MGHIFIDVCFQFFEQFSFCGIVFIRGNLETRLIFLLLRLKRWEMEILTSLPLCICDPLLICYFASHFILL
jgi:hypothetical protein